MITVDPGNVVRSTLPDTIFGFNIRWNNFESDFWQIQENRVSRDLVSALQPFAGAVYRYPGGTVANSFQWEATRQPMETRRTFNARAPRSETIPLFGIDEYLGFVAEVSGQPFYTINLLGRESGGVINEFPSQELAASNQRLAVYLRQRLAPFGTPRIYQLGNELDRGTTEWSHQKYVSRALDTMKAIQEVDPQARFVAFVREFDWRYRLPGRSGISRHETLISDVLRGLPGLDDLSLNIYYDGSWRKGGKFLAISDVMERIGKVLALAHASRPDRPVSLWVTEHARNIGQDENGRGRDKQLASGLGGALSSADFLIGLSQIPEVQGASWHSLNGVDRRLFEPGSVPEPSAVYWAMRVLRTAPLGASVLHTRTASPNLSGYPGGYDVRAVALQQRNEKTFALWVVNRENRPTTAILRISGWQQRQVTVHHHYLAGLEDVAADAVGSRYRKQLSPAAESARFDRDSQLTLELPPSSVSSFLIAPTN